MRKKPSLLSDVIPKTFSEKNSQVMCLISALALKSAMRAAFVLTGSLSFILVFSVEALF
jgi:hypothetical protein